MTACGDGVSIYDIGKITVTSDEWAVFVYHCSLVWSGRIVYLV